MWVSMHCLRRSVGIAGLILSTTAFGARPAPVIEARVTHVTDGDSLWVQPAAPAAAIEVRLVDIDAPEICQPWGKESLEALRELVRGKTVQLQAVARDPYGRTLARVTADGVYVNQRLVQEGHAWSARGRWDRGPLMKEERMAHALRRGLHSQAGALMPRDFRRIHGSCRPAPSPAAPASGAPVAFRCDGRTRCGQMTSCAEATFFAKSCPGAKMDGNRDGVPCERTLCAR
jgi:endonuclease YncB( thermonuclease family)